MKNDVVRWNFMNSQQENTNSLFRRRSLITTTKTRTATATKIRATLPPENAEGIETNEVLVDKTLDEISNNKCDKIRKKLNLQKQIINEVQSIYLVQAKSQTTTKRKTKSRHCLKFKNNECSKQLRTSLESYRRNNGGKSASGSGSGSGCDLSGILKLGLHFVSIVLLCSLNIGFASGKSPINASSILMSHNSVATTSDSNLIVQSSEFDSTSSVKPIEWDGEQQVDDGHYTHTWAVHIPNGDIDGMADNVAREHGFVNHGKIFDDHYHFSHSKIFKRSVEPSLEHHARLSNDERVFWAKQQKAKSRTKRDLLKMWPSRTSQRSLSLVDTMPFMDPKWPQMWYLNRGGGLDMNVIPAWKEGITGKGIVVTILDDGLESDHPDIRDNYDPLASYDVNSHDNDPMPHYDMTDSNRHGTRCAGEVAATANNSICAVGIAYGASVGGVRMLDGDVTDAVEARSLSHNMQHIDIYSASWGPDDDGKTVDGPGELATRAFIEGVTKGRQGKGSIFIWASGNGGREMDNCNCDGYTNSIWTLSISSATEDGHVPWYSEKCSSTLATTYSSGSQNEKQVITTDLHHTCTVSHTGTSASAPLAAGIAALVLESNQNLTWRDLQHIVVRTAKPANLIDPTWTRNGVGRRISHSFGYGLMDAAAMVKMARFWKTVPEQQRCEINAPHVNKVIPPKTYITLQLTVKHCLSVNFLEHVQAKISLTTQRRGDIQLYLKSPAGTKVTLLTLRMHDSSRSGFNQWPFMSVHTWGESPHGNWQLEIHNEGRFMAQISQWDLIFYGTEIPAQPDDPVEVPPKFAPFGNEMENNDIEFESNGQWRNMQQVGESNVISSESKTASCVRFSVDHRCLECPELSYMVDGSCVWECPRNTYPLIQNQNESNSVLNTNLLDDIKIQRTCGKCDVSCLDCTGPLFTQCSSCYPGSQLRTRMNNETYCYTFAERSSGQIKIIENTQIISKIRSLFGNFGNVFTILAIFSVIGIVVYKFFDLKNKRGTYAKVSYELDSELLLENEEEEVFSRSNIKEYKDLEKPNNEIE